MNEEQILPEEPVEKSNPYGVSNMFFDVVEMFAWALFVAFLVFTFAVRLCRVDGSSMENTLYENENLLIYSLNYTPQQDDMIVFHLTDKRMEKTLVKRVIATGGQTVSINFTTAEIYVDGVKYDDRHAVLKNQLDQDIGIYFLKCDPNSLYYDEKTDTFTAKVPEGMLFVLGDNRNWSKDSRSAEILFVDERSVLGKVVVRLFPFTVFS